MNYILFMHKRCVFVLMCVFCAQVGETSVVNVDCSKAGPGELSLEAALDTPPTSPTGSAPRSGKAFFFFYLCHI